MSVVANVAINVDSRGATQKLREVQQAAQQAQRALEGLGATSASQPFRTASSSASELIGVLGRLSAAYLGLRTAQQAVQAGIEREESGRRLTFLAKGYGEVAKAQELAAQSGRIFGLSATESNKQFAQLYGRLRPLNVSIEDINAAFVGFNTAAKVSGATSAESAGALLQLTQALGSGVLRGQELNSVLEQAPGLVVALTKELGKPVSEIRKLAEQGEITSDVVIRALKRAGTEGADELAAAMNGPAQAVKNLQNEFENFQVAATQDLIPTVVDAMKGLRELLISLGPVIRGIGGIAAQTIGTITDLINAATKPGATAASMAIKGGRLPLAGFGGMSGAGELFKGTSGAFGTGLTGLKAEAAFLAKQRRQPVTDVLLQLMQNRLQRMEAPAQVATPDLPSTFISTAGDSGSGGGRTKAPKERKSHLPELQIELELAQKIAALNLRIAEAKDKGNRTTEYALEMDKILEERSAAIAKNNLQDIPVAEKNLQTQIATVQANEKINQIIIERNRISKEAVSAAEKALADSQKEIGTLQVKRDRQAEYAKLIREGVLPANAENYLQTKELVKEALKSAEAAIVEAEARGASADEVDRLRKNLESIRGAGQTGIDKAKAPDKGATITDAITKARGELNELLDMEKQVVAAAQAIGDAFSQAFRGLVTGAMTGQEALAAFFKGVGDHFMDMAAKMIAKLIEIYILETVLGFITGAVSGSGSFKSKSNAAGKATFGGSFKGTGASTFGPGAIRVPGYADGGFVTGPTRALIGEGGEPEYVIPASKMRTAMSRYSAGARGESVIPGSGSSGSEMGNTSTMTPAVIDVRYTVERINNVDYVTADQFRAGMQNAAREGANRGEQQALRRLQNAPSARRRVGI